MNSLKKINNINYLRISPDNFVDQKQGICDACGAFGPFRYAEIINDKLAQQWELTAKQRQLMSARESMFCAFCGCSFRLRLLARAIKIWAKSTKPSLYESIESNYFNKLDIAEINSCGVLHEILKMTPKLRYSEYGSKIQTVPNEDLQSLTYVDNSFDLVITSDTLEHVPDPEKALQEILRILKPGGTYIMSVPVVLTRNSIRRAHISNSKISYDLAKSYHGSGETDYLVWNEFGHDFIDLVNKQGFHAKYWFVNSMNLDDPAGIIVANQRKASAEDIHIEVLKGSVPLVKSIVNKFDIKKYQLSTYDPDEILNPAWQIKRIEWLDNKNKLTENHIKNLTEINNAQKIYINDQKNQLDSLSSEINTIKGTLQWKVINKFKR